jgi:hypothetical protein
MAKQCALSPLAILVALVFAAQAWAEPPDPTPESKLDPKIAQAIENLGSASAEVAQQAERDLINFNDQAIPALSELSREGKSERVERAKATLAKLVTRHIQTLDSESNKLADAAEASLVKLKQLAIPSLKEIVDSGTPSQKTRATRVLEKIDFHTHVIQDALGEPIPGAELEFNAVLVAEPGEPPGKVRLKELSDERGQTVLEMPANLATASLRLRHPEYGIGEIPIRNGDLKGELKFPLVKASSNARAQALKGTVVDSADKPEPGATVRVVGLLPQDGRTGMLTDCVVVTDDEGRFAIYPVRRDMFGKPVQPLTAATKGKLRITAQHDQGLFPRLIECSCKAEITVRLERAERAHKFKFANLTGGWLEDANDLKQVYVHYREKPDSLPMQLDNEWVFHGAKLLPGFYSAAYKSHNYSPLHVTADSPDDLEFRFPKALPMRGRVINGANGAPMPGAFVFGIVSSGIVNGIPSTRSQSLARLTNDDWERLRKLPADAAPNDPSLAFIAQCFGLGAFSRTDESGKYEIVQKPEEEIHSVLAVDKDFLPILQPKYGMKVGETAAEVPDLPLFPAGKVLIRPVCEKRVSVTPVWKFLPDGRPEWFQEFEAATNLKLQRRFDYDRALELSLQPVFVPADTDVKIELKAHYHDEWSAITSAATVRVRQGETQTLGELSILPAVPVKVQVIDAEGKPLAGVLLRRDYGDRVYGRTQPTDANGRASFYVNRNSRGSFSVAWKETGGIPKRDKDPNMFASFEIGVETPGQPFTIQLTADQVKRLERRIE